MLGMIQRQMPTTQLCPVCLEGTCIFILFILLYFNHLLYSTQKIVGISTLSRTDHAVAQTREFQCTTVVLPQVIARGEMILIVKQSNHVFVFTALNVTEDAHDMQAQVSKYVTQTLKLVNSYDTWHGNNDFYHYDYFICYKCLGTKNVARQMKKITEGRVRDRDLTWFPELTDKRK